MKIINYKLKIVTLWTNVSFAKIASGTIPSEQVYSDESIVAFADIHPKAPVHLLIIPRKHVPTIDDLTAEDNLLIAHMIKIAQQLSRTKNIHQTGYRLIFNVRAHGGQEIDHLHLHLIGGQKLGPMA